MTDFHLGIFDHGSDCIQDYDQAEADLLVWGGASATANAGVDGVSDACVIYRPPVYSSTATRCRDALASRASSVRSPRSKNDDSSDSFNANRSAPPFKDDRRSTTLWISGRNSVRNQDGAFRRVALFALPIYRTHHAVTSLWRVPEQQILSPPPLLEASFL